MRPARLSAAGAAGPNVSGWHLVGRAGGKRRWRSIAEAPRTPHIQGKCLAPHLSCGHVSAVGLASLHPARLCDPVDAAGPVLCDRGHRIGVSQRSAATAGCARRRTDPEQREPGLRRRRVPARGRDRPAQACRVADHPLGHVRATRARRGGVHRRRREPGYVHQRTGRDGASRDAVRPDHCRRCRRRRHPRRAHPRSPRVLRPGPARELPARLNRHARTARCRGPSGLGTRRDLPGDARRRSRHEAALQRVARARRHRTLHQPRPR